MAFKIPLLIFALMVSPVWAESARASDVPILVYHHIQDLPSNASASMHRWSLSPKLFETHMDWIEDRGFHTVSMEQLIGHLKHGLALPPKPIVLTFDDGWKDHYSVAYPILKKHHFTATFFIITDMVGHSAYVKWGQVLQMSAGGMDIQGHTITHPRLPTLSHEEARHEIADSKKILENHLNKPVTILAYPYGSYNDDVINITKDAGYEGAATISGLNGGYLYRADQSYTLVRYAIEGGESLEYLAHAKGF